MPDETTETTEATPDAEAIIAEAQKNAANILKDAQRKQSEAARLMQEAREAAAKAPAQNVAESIDDLDPQIVKLISDAAKPAIQNEISAYKQEAMKESMNAVIEDFMTENEVSEEDMEKIGNFFDENSIRPDSVKAMRRALKNAHKTLKSDPEAVVESIIAEQEKNGAVVRINRKTGKLTTEEEKPTYERDDLSFAEKVAAFAKRKE